MKKRLWCLSLLICALLAAPASAADRMPGWRIRRAADNAAAAAANANRLVLDAQRQLDAVQAAGYVDVEIDLSINPPTILKGIAGILGFDGKISVRVKIPQQKK
jgi:hypothetical protein